MFPIAVLQTIAAAMVWIATWARFLDRVGGLAMRLRDLLLSAGEATTRAAAETRTGLAPRQRITLDVGSSVIVGLLGLGLQVGHWSAWTALPVVSGYVVWVVAYSELTIRVTRTRAERAPSSGVASAST